MIAMLFCYELKSYDFESNELCNVHVNHLLMDRVNMYIKISIYLLELIMFI